MDPIVHLPTLAILLEQVSKEATVAVSQLARSLQLVMSPSVSPPWSFARAPPSRAPSPPSSGRQDSDIISVREQGTERSYGERSTDSAERPGDPNDWSSVIPLPRLALLSGLVSLRLDVSLAGVQARVPVRGFSPDELGWRGRRDGAAADASPPFEPPRDAAHAGRNLSRGARARRCVRRVARQLVERIHPVGASPGYRQACRLFRDEMVAMGYGKAVSAAVLRALAETMARLRDPARQDEGKDQGLASSPESMAGPDGAPMGGGPKSGSASDVREERRDVRELVEAGMASIHEALLEADESGGLHARDDVAHMDVLSVEVSRMDLIGRSASIGGDHGVAQGISGAIQVVRLRGLACGWMPRRGPSVFLFAPFSGLGLRRLSSTLGVMAPSLPPHPPSHPHCDRCTGLPSR